MQLDMMHELDAVGKHTNQLIPPSMVNITPDGIVFDAACGESVPRLLDRLLLLLK
jgi:hypothetical protein